MLLISQSSSKIILPFSSLSFHHMKPSLFLIVGLLLLQIPFNFSSQQNRQAKQCGLPSNLNELPDFAQDEIRAVWKEYVPGKKCDKEMLITEDILAVLAMFDKELERQGMKTAGGTIGQPNEGEITLTTTNTVAELITAPETTQPPPPTAQQFRRVDTVEELEKRNEDRIVPTIPSSTLPPPPTRPPHSHPPLVNLATSPSSLAQPPTPFGPPTGPRQIVVENSNWPHSIPAQHIVNPATGHGHQPGKVPHQGIGKFGDRSNDQVREDDDEEEENLKEEEVKRPIKQRILAEYEDRDDEGQNAEDGFATAGEGRDLNNQPFFEPANQLPFLKGAKPSVIGVFKQVLEDPTIPSETRRMEEIHVLAVSYLNARQLVKFNAWSTERRKKIHLREHRLSESAQKALERLTRATNERERRAELEGMGWKVRNELHKFAKENEGGTGNRRHQ